MSEFHYDENGMYDVSKNLLATWMNVSSSVGKIDKVINELYGSEGFNIDYAISGLNEEKKNTTACAEKIYSGVNVISQLKNALTSYESLAVAMSEINSFKSVDNADLYQSIAKYGHDYDIVIAGIFDSIVDGTTFSVSIKSDATDGLEKAINKMLENCGMPDEQTIQKVYDEILKGSFKDASSLKKIFPNLKKSDELYNSFNKTYDSIFDVLGNTGYVLELADDVYATVAAQYFTVHEYLDTMAEAYSGNDKILKIIENYRLTYTNQFESVMVSIRDWMVNSGYKNMTSNMIKLLPDALTQKVSVIGYGLKLTEKAFGYDELYKSSLTLNGLDEVRSETATAYQNMLNKISSGNYTDADIKTASNLFDVYKSTLKTEYETMIAIEKNKMDSATNWFIHPDQLVSERREKTAAPYKNQIAEYEAKIKEIDAMVNPFK